MTCISAEVAYGWSLGVLIGENSLGKRDSEIDSLAQTGRCHRCLNGSRVLQIHICRVRTEIGAVSPACRAAALSYIPRAQDGNVMWKRDRPSHCAL